MKTQASLRSTRQDMDRIAANGEPLELPLRRKSPKVCTSRDRNRLIPIEHELQTIVHVSKLFRFISLRKAGFPCRITGSVVVSTHGGQEFRIQELETVFLQISEQNLRKNETSIARYIRGAHYTYMIEDKPSTCVRGRSPTTQKFRGYCPPDTSISSFQSSACFSRERFCRPLFGRRPDPHIGTNAS